MVLHVLNLGTRCSLQVKHHIKEHCIIAGWMGLKVVVDALGKRKIPSPA
jgi:hypothetical protein